MTKKAEELSASEILSKEEPGLLFTGDISVANKEFKELAKLWHPDVNKSLNATKVFTHIKKLYDEATESLKAGRWQIPGLLILNDIDGRTVYNIKYKKRHSFELGNMFISDTKVIYLIDNEHEELFNNAIDMTVKFNFADEKMKQEVERYLPKVLKTFKTTENKHGMVIDKNKDLLLLKDVLNYFNGQIDSRHVAWIMSRLHGLTCYLSYASLSHNAITTDNFFISPPEHTGALFGGWWYTTKIGEKLKGVASKVYDLMPWDIIASKIADQRLDLELIRNVGRELLGDETGSKLLTMKAAPEAMINWLRLGTSGNAIEDFEKWGIVLKESFGKRRFVELKLTSTDIYKE